TASLHTYSLLVRHWVARKGILQCSFYQGCRHNIQVPWVIAQELNHNGYLLFVCDTFWKANLALQLELFTNPFNYAHAVTVNHLHRVIFNVRFVDGRTRLRCACISVPRD